MAYTAAVITVSDKCSTGERIDTSGPAVVSMLKEAGYDVIFSSVVPDEQDIISAELVKCEHEIGADLIVTTGGTGLSRRDVTPQATKAVVDYEIPAIPQAMLYFSLQITPRAMLSRAAAGVRGSSLIINLPGSEKAARENLSAVVGTLDHALKMMAGGGH
ncbi:MAG: MogA/MoaB family molybdenum cofactor biosynthesis protein [Oscillospiraceae bacterium]|nr:MogA/MoaB family molybdenum cofactor biosynthesis protein [Oscillospiraceae bacterium]